MEGLALALALASQDKHISQISLKVSTKYVELLSLIISMLIRNHLYTIDNENY